jgi:predicted dinucleotide-utilizing enzyme
LCKRKSLLQKFTRDFSVLMEVCAWVRAVFENGRNILKMGTPASKMSLGALVLEQPQMNATRKEWMRSFRMTGV